MMARGFLPFISCSGFPNHNGGGAGGAVAERDKLIVLPCVGHHGGRLLDDVAGSTAGEDSHTVLLSDVDHHEFIYYVVF